MPLGFVGLAELALPELFQTAATLEWVRCIAQRLDTSRLQRIGSAKSAPDWRGLEIMAAAAISPHKLTREGPAPPGAVNLSLSIGRWLLA